MLSEKTEQLTRLLTELVTLFKAFIECRTLTQLAAGLVPVHDSAARLLATPDHPPPVKCRLQEQMSPPPRVVSIPPGLDSCYVEILIFSEIICCLFTFLRSPMGIHSPP